MEKRRPSYDLGAIQRAIGTAQTLAITVAARLDAAALGFDRGGIAEIIRTIEKPMFVKSMTTFATGELGRMFTTCPLPASSCVKFQADRVTEFRVMSFTEK